MTEQWTPAQIAIREELREVAFSSNDAFRAWLAEGRRLVLLDWRLRAMLTFAFIMGWSAAFVFLVFLKLIGAW